MNIKVESEEGKPFLKSEKNLSSKISVQRDAKNFKMVNPLKVVRYPFYLCHWNSNSLPKRISSQKRRSESVVSSFVPSLRNNYVTVGFYLTKCMFGACFDQLGFISQTFGRLLCCTYIRVVVFLFQFED